MTDLQLQLRLAKMLPEELFFEKRTGKTHWRKHYYDYVLDTEWLHVCWLAEEELHSNWELQNKYVHELETVVLKTKHSGQTLEFGLINASWQQRAQALCEVKGVTIE